MQYQSQHGFTHDQADKIGILVTNLGTPDAPTPSALRRYLAQFLGDPRVVERPRWLWKLVLHGIILRVRPARSAKAYSTVWTDEGSPLAIHVANQAKRLTEHFSASHPNVVLVSAMRYGSPSMDSAIDELLQKGVRKLFVLPLYPQYSGATTGSTFDALATDFIKRRWLPELRFLSEYCGHKAYIKAMADSIREFWAEHGQAEKLVMSYHGIPLSYVHKGDPYHCQCLKTSRLIAEELGLNKEQYLTTFQSRFGPEQWVEPYTDFTLKQLASDGVKHVQVVCPGFSADCLETIEEIGEENCEYFMEAGGEKFEYIPALNASDRHIGALAEIIEENIQGWAVASPQEIEQRAVLAKGCPHNQKK